MIYEDRYTRPITRKRFAQRMSGHLAMAVALVFISLLGGMAGYAHYEHLAWRDAFLNTAMLLGGMGPVDPLKSNGGKIFAGLFALYAGGVFLVVAALLLTPVVHRLMHKFHWEEEERRRGGGAA
ncbi:MAG TPA: hypothetical protein VKQ05_09475 [Gemmatimonadales bacterium]|nr:hypothetical protein [Gemmatimonadales bacterium]